MAELSVIWLRVAAALYSLGLLHAILMLVRRREHLFQVAFTAFTLGTVFHFVSIIEEGIVNNRCPISNFYETLSMCAFFVAIGYLGVQLRYHLESLSAFIFPLVFVMAMVATLGNPVSAWSSPLVRSAWLSVHIVLVLLGYAALVFTAVASLLYLVQEHELKAKRPNRFYYRLPALGMLDDVLRHHAIHSHDLYAVAGFLARTRSRLLAISLEDLLGMIDQPNIPGTVNEHPNWRQRLPVAIDYIAAAIDVAALRAATSERARAAV